MKCVGFAVAVMLLALAETSGATTPYEIDFKLTNALSYDAMDISVNYAAANGGFSGSGEFVACTPNASLNATMVFNDVSPVLKSGLMRLTAIAGPAVLFTCVFDSNSGTPSASNFVISVTSWHSPSTTTPPSIQISRIQVQ
jgi:hypothetical protein